MDVKNVCFVRHAKSSWDRPGIRDLDRPLNDRGLVDAPLMARQMNDLELAPDLIISSNAQRALSTAQFFQAEFHIPEENFLIRPEIYEASPEIVFDVIRDAPDHASFIYIFGHNPTFTWIANSISGVHIDNVPTCGIVHVQAALSSWKKFKPEYTAFVGFYFPKQFRI